MKRFGAISGLRARLLPTNKLRLVAPTNVLDAASRVTTARGAGRTSFAGQMWNDCEKIAEPRRESAGPPERNASLRGFQRRAGISHLRPKAELADQTKRELGKGNAWGRPRRLASQLLGQMDGRRSLNVPRHAPTPPSLPSPTIYDFYAVTVCYRSSRNRKNQRRYPPMLCLLRRLKRNV